jgi:copper chaperone CopZ
VNKTLRFLVPALIAIVMAAGGSWLYAQVRSLPDTSHLSARAGQRIVTLDVGGLHCDQCVAVVKGQLSNVRGVSAVEVRRDQKRAFIVCDRAVPDSALISAVHAAGPGFFSEVVE